MSTPRRFDKTDLLSKPKPVARPVQVGGSLQSYWVSVPLFLGGVPLAIGVIAAYNGEVWLLWALLPFAAAFALPGVVAAVVLITRARFIQVTPDGFVLTQGGKREAFRDDQIVGVSQRTIQKATLWREVTLDVHTEAGAASFDMLYEVPAGQPDPLWEFLDRVIRAHARRVMDGLEQGARLDGAGWHYDRRGLHVHRGTYSPEEFTFFSFQGSALSIWRGGEVLPFFRVPEETPNVHALSQLVWSYLEKRPGLNDPLPEYPLGRLLSTHQGRDSWLGWLVFGFGGFLLLLAVAALVVMAFTPSRGDSAVIPLSLFAAVSLAIAGVGFWLVSRASYLRLDYHQFGIAQPGLGRSLLFTEIARMTWMPSFVLLEAHDPDRPPIRFSSIWLAQDRDVIAIRDHIASVIANRWWEELGRGPVRWTERMRFLPEGLEYRPRGLFGLGEPQVAPYHATSYYALAQWLEVFVVGAPAAVVQQPYGEANFYPGLKLLDWIYEWLRKQYQEQQQAGQQQDHRVDFSKWRGGAAQPDQGRYRASDGPERQITPGP